jgi:DNA-binding transcriptional MocR family regulator
MKRPVEHTEFLYADIAERLGSQIHQYILKTGDKLPSVRALSKEQGISISTAYKAYSELEIKGLVEARPKSGYYVRYNPPKPIKPQIVSETTKMKDVSLDEMIAMIYHQFIGEGITKFSLAVPALSLIPQAKLNKSLMECIRLSANSCINYEDVQGNSKLRKYIAQQTFNWGGAFTADDVITTQGCMEALVFCLKTVTKPGDTIAIESPAYFGIFGMIQSLNLRVVEIPTDAEHGVDLDYLKTALGQGNIKACLFVPSFSNPLGYCMSNERKEKLVTLLAQFEVPLIEDDIYGEMYFGKTRPRTCKSYDKKGLVMLCSSVSKTLAPGYRVGWCIPGKFKDDVLKLKFMNNLSSPAPTHAAIGHFFETGRYDLHMRKLRKALHTQCLRYTQCIADHFPDTTKVSRPGGGYVLWIELDKLVNAADLFQQALEQKISISPGQIFTSDGRFTNFIRIGFGQPFSAEIEKSISVLGKLIKGLSEKNKSQWHIV